MLAPRKTLWSTPDRVIANAIDWVPLAPHDKVVDVGCGDGRVLLNWAMHLSSSCPENSTIAESMPCFVGIDIDETRISQARENLDQAREQGKIATGISIIFHCANALEALPLFREATVLFLYLIPRGLKILQRDLLSDLAKKGRLRRVITYMSPLPNEDSWLVRIRREVISVPHQPGAAWPLYLYQVCNEH